MPVLVMAVTSISVSVEYKAGNIDMKFPYNATGKITSYKFDF